MQPDSPDDSVKRRTRLHTSDKQLETNTDPTTIRCSLNENVLINELDRTQAERRANFKRQESIDSTKSELEPNEEPEDADFTEIFDPSLIFIAVYKCNYWDPMDRVRKGKMFMTAREMFFKCSGMPFIKLRVDLREISDVHKIKNHKQTLKSVLSVQTPSKAYVFYKFRLPRNVVRSVILQLVGEAKSREIEELRAENANSDAENLNPHKLRLKKMGQPFQNFASIIRTSFNPNGSSGSMSKSESSGDDETDPKEKKISRYQRNIRQHFRRTFSLDKSDENETHPNDELISELVPMEPVILLAEKPPEIEPESTEVVREPVPVAEVSPRRPISRPRKTTPSAIVSHPKVQNSAATVFVFMVLSLVVFLALAVNNFMKLNMIERQIYDLR